MADDWQAGDLALCIAERGYDRPAPVLNPRKGHIYCVIHTAIHPEDQILGLVFRDDRGTAFNAENFRKVTPRHPDEFDREVIDLMTRQPAKVPA